MITVRVPAEIRKYKEKIAGLITGRQFLAILGTSVVCVPLYYFATDLGINEEVRDWLVLIFAIAGLSFGFVTYNGLPMEKLSKVMLCYFLFPHRRTVITKNRLRTLSKREDFQNAPQGIWQKYRHKYYQRQASLERTVYMEEAIERGDFSYESAPTENLVTVKKPSFGRGNKDNDNKKKTKKEKQQQKWEQDALLVRKKLEENPEYVPDKNEAKLLKRLNQKEFNDRKRVIEEKKKEVDQKNKKLKKRRTVQIKIPRSVADTIPILAAYEEGMFEVAPNKYSKAYLLSDINYKTAKTEEQTDIFCRLRDFYNSFPGDVHIQMCVDNRVVSTEAMEKEVFYPMAKDGYDKHRKEYNRIMGIQMTAGHNNMKVEKYLVITIDAAEPYEAILRFRKMDSEVVDNLRKLGVYAKRISTTERLAYFHDKFRPGQEGQLRVDYDFLKQNNLSEKDYISPPSFYFGKANMMQIGDTYSRIMYLTNYPASLSDEIMRSFYDVDFPVTVTFNIQPVDHAKAMRLVQTQLTSIKKDKMEAERKAIRDNYSPDNIRQDIKDGFEQYNQLYDDMLNNDQKLFFNFLTVMVGGATLQELESNCEVLNNRAQGHMCEFQTLNFQQEEAYKTTLPFGYVSNQIGIDRSMTSESTTVFIPFTCTELYQLGGFYYGLNAISRNFVMLDRNKMKTPSGFVLGTSGSGKSFATKREILNVLLHDNDSSVIIIDPENEYSDFVRAFGGVVIRVAPDSEVHLSPMDMPEDYGLDEEDGPDTPMPIKKAKAIKKKSGFLMSIVERMIAVGGNADVSTILPQQKTIVDNCVREVYDEYLKHDFDPAFLPSLLDLQACLDRKKGESKEAYDLAVGVEYYTRGSMDVFAHQTNVDVNNRLISFNVRDIGEQLRMIALVIVFDFIWNRMVQNKARSVRTYAYCDEIHIMFKSFYAADFLKQLFKRGRKYGLCITGLTQNCAELLATEQARGMIGNSDYILMLNQKAEDLELLAEMLGISDEQRRFVSGVDAGCGLLFAEKTIVPFVDDFPKDSYLYKLMSTKFGEDMPDEEAMRHVQEIMAS